MTKTILFYAICLAPVLFGMKLWSDAVALHDQHILKVARCMAAEQKRLDISPQEAYIVCEKEVR